ncbi:hypothetical protein [Roseateles amylovorans]|uniref:Uncharacterized protein n=1 Tax=Roseateles amylovorans TaxID=2978473 RepID=A0ABY6AXV5_9BURK|nr:hypothetical protein [Roseateles amylovorans]UXH77738.1 hypothetical protein N4261_22590 [Roseateles amylovorans]
MHPPTDAEAAAMHRTLIHRTAAQLPRLVGGEYLHCHQPVDVGQGFFYLIKEN